MLDSDTVRWATLGLAVIPFAWLLIVVHELGHYGAARAFRISVHSVTIGAGPQLLHRDDRNGTSWILRLIPAWGFVHFTVGPGCYDERSPAVRIAVIAAGPFANLALAIGLFGILLGVQGELVVLPHVDGLVPGGSADRAGVLAGDLIVAINNQPVGSFQEIAQLTGDRAEHLIKLTLQRGDESHAIAMRLGCREEGGRMVGSIGVIGATRGYRALASSEIPGAALRITWHSITTTFAAIANMSPNANPSAHIDPASMMNHAVTPTWAAILFLAAVVSGNVAAFNLLPLPILDGGQIVLCAIEAARHLSPSAKWRRTTAAIGALMLLLLVTYLTLHEIAPT